MEFGSRGKRLVVTLGGLLVLALGLGAYLLLRPDPHLARAQELGRKLAREGGGLSEDERRELTGELRSEMRQLSPEQRRRLFRERRQRRVEELKAYFALPPGQRIAFLDRKIAEMEEARPRWQEVRGQGAFPRPPRSTDPDERERRRRDRLDSTTPEERAMMKEFFQAMGQRRQQLGLPAFAPWGGNPGGGH